MRPQAAVPGATSGAAPGAREPEPAVFGELLADLARRHAAGALSPEALRASLALLAARHESEVSTAVTRAVAEAAAKAAARNAAGGAGGGSSDPVPAQPRSSLALELGSALCGRSDSDSDDDVDNSDDGGLCACACAGGSGTSGAAALQKADTSSTLAAGDGASSSIRGGAPSSAASGASGASSSGDLGAGVWGFLFPGEEACCHGLSAPERELSGATGLTSTSGATDDAPVQQPGPSRCRCCSRLCGLPPSERGAGRSGGLTLSRSSSSLDEGGGPAPVPLGAASRVARGGPTPLRLAPLRARAAPAERGVSRAEEKGLPSHGSPQLLSDGASACSRGTESTCAPSDRHIPSCFCPACSAEHDDD